MEISAINAVSPRQIDWRKLTAKEIIKYENQGVEVPNEYLQWAKRFQEEINSGDKDDTTYESAVAASANATSTQSSAESAESEEEPEDAKKLSASDVRDEMLNSGKSYLKVATTFSKESKTRAKDAQRAEVLASNIGGQSDSDVESLETALSSLMAEADDIKSQINSLKNKSSNDNSLGNAAKIQQLQRQLKQLGISGQSLASETDADLNEYTSILGEQSEIDSDAVDYGNVTIEMGDNVKKMYWMLYGIGRRISKNGKKAVEKGENSQKVVQEADSKVSQNISQVAKSKNEILAKTGVGEASANDNKSNAKNEDNGKSDDKSQTEQGKTQQEVVASGNMDEILKYKMRKGEDINENA